MVQSYAQGKAPWETGSSPETFAQGKAPWETTTPSDNLIVSAAKGTINTAVGAGRWLGNGAYSVAKDIVKPMLQVGATAGAGLLVATGQAMGKSPEQINTALDASKGDSGIQPYANMPSFLGGLLDTASWLIPVGEEAKVAGEVTKGAAGAVKKAVTSGVGKFAAAQGGAAGLKAKGEGATTPNAVGEGVGAYLGNLAFIGVASKAGQLMGSWGKTLSSTKAGQILAERVTSAMDSFHAGVTPEVVQRNAKTFIAAIHSASEKLSKGISGFYNEATTKLMKQYDPNGMKGLISDTYANLKPTRMGIAENFKKVFDFNLAADSEEAAAFRKFMDGMGAKAKSMEATSVDTATKDIEKIQTTMQAAGHSTGDIYKAIQDYTAKLASGAKQKTIAPGLGDYIDEIQTRVINPMNSGRPLSASILDDFIHYIQPNGTSAEKAQGKQIQDALYNMFGDGMKKSDPALYKTWTDARESFRQLGNTLDQKWAGLIHDMNHPQQFADEIVNGNYFKTPQDTKEMIKLFGADNHEQIQDSIMRRLFEIAQATHKAVIGSGGPEGLAKAGKAVASVFDNFLLKAEKASDGSVRLMTAERTEFLQHARDTLTGDLWSFAKNGKKEIGMDAAALEKLYGSVTRAGGALDTALKNPSELASQISKMSPEDISVIKSLHTPEQWASVSANVLKNIADKSKSIFSKGFSVESAGKFVDMIDKIGGDNRSQVFETLFGDHPEVKKGIEALVSSMEDIKTLDAKSGSAIRGMAHGVSAFIFGALHHPILATGEARKSLSQFSNMSAKEIESKLTEELKATGKISTSWFKTIISALANSGTLKKVGGRQTGEGVASFLQGQENQ